MRLRGTTAEDLEAEGEDTDGLVENASKLYDIIKKLTAVGGKEGISIIDENGDYKSTYQILKEISDVYDQMDDASQAALLEKIAGKTRGAAAAAILQNGDILDQVYSQLENGEAEGAGEKALETSLNSIETKITLFKNEFQKLWTDLIDSDMTKSVVDLGTSIISTFDKMAKTAAPVLDLIVTPLTKILELLTKIMDLVGGAGSIGLIAGLAYSLKNGGRFKMFNLLLPLNTVLLW